MSFFADHAPVVSTILGGAVTLIGILLMAYLRLYTKHNEEKQSWQDDQIQELQDKVNGFSGDHGKFGSEITHLGKTLEKLVQELKEERKDRHLELARERGERKQAERENREDHQEIKGLIKREWRTATT